MGKGLSPKVREALEGLLQDFISRARVYNLTPDDMAEIVKTADLNRYAKEALDI